MAPAVRTWFRQHKLEVVVGLLLVLLTVLALGGVCGCGFVNYDDDVYITNNLNVQGGLGLASIPVAFETTGIYWAFKATVSNHWHPLTWLSLELDCDLFGLHPAGFHLTNLLLHLANVLLLFAILRQMTGAIGRSALFAGLFAVHPLHVESVAWVTERKDVLSTFFWLLTTAAYVSYTRRPSLSRFGWVFVFFALGLLAKPMLITLPFTLLLLDYWPLGRMVFSPSPLPQGRGVGGEGVSSSPLPCRRGEGLGVRGGDTSNTTQPPHPQPLSPEDGPEGRKNLPPFAPARFRWLIAEKAPLFLLAFDSLAVSLFAREHGGGLKSGDYLSLQERLGYAVTAYADYLGKTFWPVGLAPFYPLTPGGPSAERVIFSVGLLVLLTAALLVLGARRPYLAVGWLWYLGTLLPVSGLIQLGSYAMADRYTYVPLIGVFIALVWGVASCLPAEGAATRLAACAAVIVLLVAALLSRQQVRHWHDSIALWRHTLAATGDNALTRLRLGLAYQEAGRPGEAEVQFLAATRLRPDLAVAQDILGSSLLQQGRAAEAAACFRKAIELQPASARYHLHLEQALRALGKTAEAEK
jgi:tetratricopeptide (TPR) repeat protein